MRVWTIIFSVFLVALFVTSTPAIYAAPPSQEETTYTVQSGDSLWMLAEKYLGSGANFPTIVEATNQQHQTDNSYANISDPAVLLPGMKLLIPAGMAEPATMPEPAPAPEAAMVPEIVASAEDIVVDGLNFPEAPYWSTTDNRLYFLKDAGDCLQGQIRLPGYLCRHTKIDDGRAPQVAIAGRGLAQRPVEQVKTVRPLTSPKSKSPLDQIEFHANQDRFIRG
jgi:hypothetical protein